MKLIIKGNFTAETKEINIFENFKQPLEYLSLEIIEQSPIRVGRITSKKGGNNMKLKTLKDMSGEDFLRSNLRQEAIKWIKELQFREGYNEHKKDMTTDLIHSVDFIKYALAPF